MMGDSADPEAVPPEVKAMGWKPGKRKGWLGLRRGQIVAYRTDAGRELRVGYVLFNDTENDRVKVQPCTSTWTGMCVVHKKEYRLPVAEGGAIVTEPTEEVVESLVPYQALVKVVELYFDG